MSSDFVLHFVDETHILSILCVYL